MFAQPRIVGDGLLVLYWRHLDPTGYVHQQAIDKVDRGGCVEVKLMPMGDALSNNETSA